MALKWGYAFEYLGFIIPSASSRYALLGDYTPSHCKSYHSAGRFVPDSFELAFVLLA